MRAQRILVVATPPALVLTLPEIFSELLERGTHLLFSGKRLKNARIPDELAGHSGAEPVVLTLRRDDGEGADLALFRRLCDLAWCLGPAFDSAAWTRRRTALR